VIPRVDVETLRFESPVLLWLLAMPAALAALWVWRLVRRRADVHRLKGARVLPVRERYSVAGDLTFWLAVLVAASLCVVAVAKPQARVSAVRRASADIVILQDASASMHVTDVRPDRWRRSVLFLRTFAESLSWRGDRVALALFAQLAAPQVRLTKDPNSLFFFLDHLGDRSPFRLENVTTWDTNVEEGIRWGLNLIEKDEQLFGKSGNPKAFVVISDGQSWSGNVATALLTARERDIPVFVVGIGTTVGGMIPEPANPDGTRPLPTIRSTLDRKSLIQIAVAGGGEYFEIGEEPDRTIAFRIVDRLRQRSANAQQVETFEDLYPRALLAAAIILCAGTLFLRKRTELVWQAAGALGVVFLIASLL
jgi:Ca-activated chloride channel family protein